MPPLLLYGIDVFLQKKTQQRFAIVTNNAAYTSQSISSRVALLQNNIQLIKIFAPEHGITANGADGVAQNNLTDPLTDLPVISLYNHCLQPTEEELNDIDAVLFDLPDVGCRFYTYLWTMTHVMEACAQYNKPLIILDRPNPVGALMEHAEGPMLDEVHCSSFIGRWNIPLKHSCTLGELALYFTATRLPHLKIDVIKVKNYQRYQTAFHDFAFTPTSPAIQKIQTAFLYPGMGLLEGVNINEGRGAGFPFQQFGAPWINSNELMQALQQQIPGVAFEVVNYKAINPPYEHQICNGVKLLITNTSQLMAVQTGFTILKTVALLYPHQLKERLYKTAVNPNGTSHLDKLSGVYNSFSILKTGQPFQLNLQQEWKIKTQPFLLYP